jgi:UMF1 family MFS transporter
MMHYYCDCFRVDLWHHPFWHEHPGYAHLFYLAQFTSILGSALFGWLTDKKGVRLSLSISILIWISVVVWAYFCGSAREYYLVGLLAGLAIGSSQANSRTMLSMLTPKAREAEFLAFIP